jgi:hypothetical protein
LDVLRQLADELLKVGGEPACVATGELLLGMVDAFDPPGADSQETREPTQHYLAGLLTGESLRRGASRYL